MNTWFSVNTCNMAYLLAEDTGAPELRNPLNSGIRATRAGRCAVRLPHALRSLIAMVTGI